MAPLRSYYLESSTSSEDAKLLVQAGDARIFYVAVPFFGGYGHCGPPDPDFHHPVLSVMLGVPEKAMGWQRYGTRDVLFSDGARYAADVQALVAETRRAIDATVGTLIEKGLLADADSAAGPKLVVEIEDQRTDKAVSLPPVGFAENRTTLGKIPLPWQ